MIAKCLDPMDTGERCRGHNGDVDGKFLIILSSHDILPPKSPELEREKRNGSSEVIERTNCGVGGRNVDLGFKFTVLQKISEEENGISFEGTALEWPSKTEESGRPSQSTDVYPVKVTQPTFT